MANQPNNPPSSAALIQKTGEDQVISVPSAAGFIDSLEQRYQKLKEHAEAYPYVWASYIVVYGGFGLWTTYRWRKLRRTEDSVRKLQQRLRDLIEAEQPASSAKVVEKGSTSSVKPSK